MVKKSLVSLFILMFSFNTIAKEQENSAIIQPIQQLFTAMKHHDSALFLKQFAENASLVRVLAQGETKISDINKFAEHIAKTTDDLDERIFNIKVLKQHKLATVWTPFAFYFNGKLSHCGVNVFLLVEQNSAWKILQLVDEAYTGDCLQFIETNADNK